MNKPATTIELLFTRAENYSRTTLELFKLNAIDKSADVVSTLCKRIAIYMVVALFILVLNIGIALWIGESMGKTYFGFFTVAGFYLLISVVLYIFRNQWIKNPINNTIITEMLKQKNQ